RQGVVWEKTSNEPEIGRNNVIARVQVSTLVKSWRKLSRNSGKMFYRQALISNESTFILPYSADELLEYLVTKLPEEGRISRVGAWFVLHEVIEACAVMNNPQQPERCYSSALQLQQQGVVMTWSYGLLERFLGIAAMSAGKFDLAEQHFRTGLQQAETIPVVPEQGEIRRWWAIML
ncbi:MAG: hypothetical protein WBN06_05790, partial [Lysobacterales bacterium]